MNRKIVQLLQTPGYGGESGYPSNIVELLIDDNRETFDIALQKELKRFSHQVDMHKNRLDNLLKHKYVTFENLHKVLDKSEFVKNIDNRMRNYFLGVNNDNALIKYRTYSGEKYPEYFTGIKPYILKHYWNKKDKMFVMEVSQDIKEFPDDMFIYYYDIVEIEFLNFKNVTIIGNNFLSRKDMWYDDGEQPHIKKVTVGDMVSLEHIYANFLDFSNLSYEVEKHIGNFPNLIDIAV